MRQVLFWIPVRIFDWLPSWLPGHIPIYGYGAMLFVAFVVCTCFASWRAKREGIAPQHLQDLALWIFAGGIVGARLTFMIQYGEFHLDSLEQAWETCKRFVMIWQGGLVFYGSAVGGFAGYGLAYVLVIRKHRLSTWKLADIVAPCVPIGLALGRIGCLLNGCCYGNVVTCEHCLERCLAVHFPLSAPSRLDPKDGLVARGLQTAAGFTISDPEVLPPHVDKVDRASPAYASGLRADDLILKVNGHAMKFIIEVRKGNEIAQHGYADWQSYGAAVESFKNGGYQIEKTVTDPLTYFLVDKWPQGQTDLTLTVEHRNRTTEELASFHPMTLGLQPTQAYESISMVLLFFLLMAYLPFRRHYGEVMALFLICYPIHRFLNEMLRNDTDPVAFGMTLSQIGSIFCLAVGLVLFYWLRFLAPSMVSEPPTKFQSNRAAMAS